MKNVLTVIPARLGSTRFPGKVLARLGTKSVVEWCYLAATKAGLGPVVVATEDKRVLLAVKAFGGNAVLTSPFCKSGTDRVYEAAQHYSLPYVINLQGDQPLIQAKTLRSVAKLLRQNKNCDIATAVIALNDAKRLKNPNVVKAALAKNGRALYFSRAAIPFSRDGKKINRFEHLGIYGFRRAELKRFVFLPPSALETAESLEQLRALEAGQAIFAAVVQDYSLAIDTPQDLKNAERFLRSHP